MSISLPPSVEKLICYPESDGKPMSDNTRQFRWILFLFGNIAARFRSDPNVFVSGNQFWYPEKNRPDIHVTPDVYVVFGRPKGDRGSYKQWEEGGVPMTVVFEVPPLNNTPAEMEDQFAFYERYGVEEYYIYDPYKNQLQVFLRRDNVVAPVWPVEGFTSPRLGIRFEMTAPEMTVFLPDGSPFKTFKALKAERTLIQERAEKAEQRAEKAEQRNTRLVELSRKARQGLATPQELEELNRLEEGSSPG